MLKEPMLDQAGIAALLEQAQAKRDIFPDLTSLAC